MKKLLLCLLGILVYGASQGADLLHETVNGRIVGSVVDSATSQPVEFATVALQDPATNKPIDGAVCDLTGKFVIKSVVAGTYDIVVSFIGFEPKRIKGVVVGDKEVDLGKIILSPSVKLLTEVTVEGQKALIEERVDRTIYNAENDATARGGDATDVLRRVPMLSVDLDGNVSLRGNSNIRVLINNRPSTITANSVADALKSIPADQIKSVEVITSPSARYDAEGSSGIINIILKKNTLEGFSLNVNTGVGNRGANLGLNGAYKKGKLGLSLGGFGRAGYNIVGNFENEQRTIRTDGVETLNLQTAETRRQDVFGRYTFGIDYDINKNNFISTSVQYGLRNSRNYQDGLRTQSFQNNSLTNSNLRDVKIADLSGTVDVNFNYTHLFEKPQHEFSILGLYSYNDRSNDFENINFNESTLSILNRLKNLNDSKNQEVAAQIDYQVPFGKNQLLELGAKEIVRDVTSDFTYFTAAGANGAYQPIQNNQLSNALNYRQGVSAGYASYTWNMGKSWGVKGGARYEYTTITASFQGGNEIDIPAYGVFVPSLNVSKRLKNGNTVKAAYNRRIQRPSIQFLNPNIQAPNPLNITIGDPTLDPEFTNNYELSYSTSVKGINLNATAFMRNTNNAIQSVRDIIGTDTIRTTFQNIGQEDAYGVSLFFNVNLGKLTLNGGGDFYYAVLENNSSDPATRASNSGWVPSARMFGGYDLGKNWALQFFGFYRSRQVQLQGIQAGFGIYSLSLNRNFANKRGSFGLGAENFFTRSITMRNRFESPTLNQVNTNEMFNMGIRANFSYRIGKVSVDNSPRRRKKTITNDDLKDGGDGGGGGEIQQGGGGGRPSGGRPSGGAPGARPSGAPQQGKPSGTPPAEQPKKPNG